MRLDEDVPQARDGHSEVMLRIWDGCTGWALAGPWKGTLMGTPVYTGIGSLDGFISDAEGGFDWSAPSEEVHSFIDGREHSVAAELYGRRLYEVMRVWDVWY